MGKIKREVFQALEKGTNNKVAVKKATTKNNEGVL